MKKDISPLIAATIHEIKNQFITVLFQIEELLADLGEAESQRTTMIKGELNIISHRFAEMLSSFKSQNFEIKPTIDQQDLEAFLEDVSIRHTVTEKTYNIKINTACDEEIFGYFDERLIQNIVDTAIYNAAQLNSEITQVLVTANWNSDSKNGDNITINIEDDGPGFPDEMMSGFLESTGTDDEGHMKAGIGLYLANTIAEAHTRGGDKGYIELKNNQNLKGACLTIHLP